MMGERPVQQNTLFYEFSLERHVLAEHLLRSIDRFVELDGVRRELAPFYSEGGRPSIDPERMIRMLIVGYCFGIRLEGPRQPDRRSNRAPERSDAQGGSRRRRGFCSMRSHGLTAISTKPLRTQLTPSSADEHVENADTR